VPHGKVTAHQRESQLTSGAPVAGKVFIPVLTYNRRTAGYRQQHEYQTGGVESQSIGSTRPADYIGIIDLKILVQQSVILYNGLQGIFDI